MIPTSSSAEAEVTDDTGAPLAPTPEEGEHEKPRKTTSSIADPDGTTGEENIEEEFEERVKMRQSVKLDPVEKQIRMGQGRDSGDDLIN